MNRSDPCPTWSDFSQVRSPCANAPPVRGSRAACRPEKGSANPPKSGAGFTRTRWFGGLLLVACLGLMTARVEAAGTPLSVATLKPVQVATVIAPRLVLAERDLVTVQVHGRPELSTTTYIADDGTIVLPLAGKVKLSGSSPATAGKSVAAAYRDGQYLVRPSATVLLVNTPREHVSVLGAVRVPGRFAMDPRATVFDALALAGGTTEAASDVVMLLRADRTGAVTRRPLDLRNLAQGDTPLQSLTLLNGDSIFVPAAAQFYLSGEVQAPSAYRLTEGLTVNQAIIRGGGVTPRGSANRIEIKRRKPGGRLVTLDATLDDPVEVNDIIRVKERIF